MLPKTSALTSIALAFVAACPAAAAAEFGPWSTARAVTELNLPNVNDGCPIESPDGLQFFMASNRPGTLGGNDIWVAERASMTAPWGVPQNLGRPVNSEANDFCPTPLPGDWLFFVSERTGPETCNAQPNSGDMYLSALRRVWRTPVHIGCEETNDGPNSTGAEFSPSLVEYDDGSSWLYFSSTRGGNMDIYMSRFSTEFESAVKVVELSSAADDRMPNVRKDGLEVVFSSNRPGSQGQDVYASTRASTNDPWSPPVLLGAEINTAGNETRASLSRDGTRLYFGRDGDIYVATRTKIRD